MAGALTEDRPGLGVNPVVKGDEQGLGEVKKTHPCAPVAPLARHRHFHAPDSAVVVCVLPLYPLFDKRGDNHLVAVKRGHPEAKAHHLDTLPHKPVVKAPVVAHGQVRLGELGLGHTPQDEIGKGVYPVLRFPVLQNLPAYGNILVERAAGGKAGVGPAPNFVNGEGFEPEIGQKLASRIFGDSSGGKVSGVERVKILVHPPVGKRMAVTLDLEAQMYQPEGLDRLVKGLRPLEGDFAEYPAHLQKLRLPARVLLRRRRLPRQISVPPREGHGGVDNHEGGAIEI